jgi:nicotinate dehydrogenase subunit B
MKDDSERNHKSRLNVYSDPVDRRAFFKLLGILGGGILIYFALDKNFSYGQMPAPDTSDFNAYLKIGTDGKVTCYVGKIEMGQGIVTSLPQIVAEELNVPYDSIDLVMGDTDLCPYDFITAGSMSTRIFGVALRSASCEARGVLKELASEYLGCPVEHIQTRNGEAFDKSNPDKKVGYGQLTKGKIVERRVKEMPSLKSPSEFTIMTRPYMRRDSRDKVTGRAKYAGDIRLPGMLYASVLRPPAHGATLKAIDVDEAKKIKDVTVVQDGDLVAVLHPHPEEAAAALGKIRAVFNLPESGADNNTIFDHLMKVAPEEKVVSNAGDIPQGRKISKELFEQTYRCSYFAHAPMETHTSFANIENGKITVWASTQSPFPQKETIAKALNMPANKVRVITPFVGGGFGGKGHPMPSIEALEAARLTKLTGKPVQVCFSRQEEFYNDTFNPASIVKISSGLDSAGNITMWDYHVYYAGDRAAELFYSIPNHSLAMAGTWMNYPDGSHPFSVGPWRAPGANMNTFARESHINIMASKAGFDPLEFRIKHLKDEKMIGVLKAVAEKFGWKPIRTPSGQGFGIACAVDANTYVAHMAEVSVDKDSGKVKVNRVVCAQDMGMSVNPEGAKIQIEGAVTMGLGYSLMEEVQFQNGKIFTKNFDTYKIPRFPWLPKIETVLVQNVDKAPQGGGEPAIVCMGAVIANAIFDATGVRVFQLPMTPARIKEALQKL